MARAPKRRPAAQHSKQRSAVVLVIVLIVVAMVALAGYSFAELMLTENKATHLHGDVLALEQAVNSAVEFLKSFCEQPQPARAMAGGTYDNPALFRAVRLMPDERSTRRAARELCFSIVSPAVEDGEATRLRFGVEDECSRLHLGDVMRWEQQQAGQGRKALLSLPGMTEPIADAMLDWMDADMQPRPAGAESDFYAGLDPPYSPRNGLPECLEELLLVKGVTRQLLWGVDANYNHQMEPDELRSDTGRAGGESRSTGAVPWASLLTVYSGRKNVDSTGQPRIDLNAMDLTKLQQQLTTAVGANWAAFIVAMRQYGPYAGGEAGSGESPPPNPGAAPRFVFGSALDLVGARVSIPSATAGQSAKIYNSPISNDAQATGQELMRLLDRTTTIPAPVIRGGVSVNHAPRAVLRAVPGMDDATADRIIAARDTTGGQLPARRFATWLLSEGVVDLARMKTLIPHLCGDGDVVRAEVLGHFDPPGQSARVEVVIDATVTPARQVAWRDLRLHGPVYPVEWFTDTETQNTKRPASFKSMPGESGGRNN